jgi:hypothetical protein
MKKLSSKSFKILASCLSAIGIDDIEKFNKVKPVSLCTINDRVIEDELTLKLVALQVPVGHNTVKIMSRKKAQAENKTGQEITLLLVNNNSIVRYYKAVLIGSKAVRVKPENVSSVPLRADNSKGLNRLEPVTQLAEVESSELVNVNARIDSLEYKLNILIDLATAKKSKK